MMTEDCKDCSEEKRALCEKATEEGNKEFNEFTEKHTGITSTRVGHTQAVGLSGSVRDIMMAYVAINETLITQMSINPIALGQMLNDYLNFIEGKLPKEYKYNTLEELMVELGGMSPLGDLLGMMKGIFGKEK